MKTYEQLAMIKSIPNQSERGGNIFDFVGMAKQVTVKREQGMNQDVSSLDYMNKVPKSKKTINNHGNSRVIGIKNRKLLD